MNWIVFHRVPRPRFRADNPPRVSGQVRRSLLPDLEAVKEDIDLHFNVDYAFRASALIKAPPAHRPSATRHASSWTTAPCELYAEWQQVDPIPCHHHQ